MAIGATTLMQPVAFSGMAGWLHRPLAQTVSPVGVVLCAPLGRDTRCAHRPMRLWAERLAAAGYPTLRYDHPGAGDSLDLPADIDATTHWLAGVKSAATFLKSQCDVAGLVLGGIRMGATLAATAAADPNLQAVEGLMLLSPVVAGRNWLRELRLTASVTAGGSVEDVEIHGMQADGLSLSGPTVRSLSALDLRTLPRAPRRVLLLTHNENARGALSALQALGSDVVEDRFKGYEELFTDSHSNRSPDESFGRTAAWLADNFALPERRRSPPAPVPKVSATLRPPGSREQPVTFGQGLRGVLCTPTRPEPRRRAVIFLNSGGDPRVGIGRFSVDAGRTLARLGVASLRFDFAGLGDSDDPPEGIARHVYETPRQHDLDAAVSFMLDSGFLELTLLGVCAGSHHALHGALNDSRVQGAMMVSPVKILWRPGDSLDFNLRDDGRATSAYLSDVWKLTTWIRLLKGDIDVWRVSKTLASRFLDRLTIRREENTARLNARIKAFFARGGRLTMLMGVDDAAVDEIEAYFGPRGGALTDNPAATVAIVPGVDHGLALAASRDTAMQMLLKSLGLPTTGAPAGLTGEYAPIAPHATSAQGFLAGLNRRLRRFAPKRNARTDDLQPTT